MKLYFCFLFAFINAAWIDGKWKTMCYKTSCARGRRHCCQQPEVTFPEVTTTAPSAVVLPITEETITQMFETTQPETTPEVGLMPSFPEGENSEVRANFIHLENGVEITFPEERSLFDIFSKDYFMQLANEIKDLDWSAISGTFVTKEQPKNFDIQSRKIVKRWGQNIFQQFSSNSAKYISSLTNKFKRNLLNQIFKKINIIFGAGWDEIHDLAEVGGEEIFNLFKSLEEELQNAVQMILENLDFDDGFSVDTLKGDLVKLLMEKLELLTDPSQVKPIRDILSETRKEFGEIMDDAVERTMMALFDEVNLILDRIQKDDNFTMESPKDELVVDLLKNLQSVLDPDGDMKPKNLIKLIRKTLKKFAKSFGKMQLIEKIEFMVEQLGKSDKPLDQAYEFFLQNLGEVLNGNKNFENVIHDVKVELLELALGTVENLEKEIQKLFENIIF